MTVCDLGNIGKMIVLQFKFQNSEMCFFWLTFIKWVHANYHHYNILLGDEQIFCVRGATIEANLW